MDTVGRNKKAIQEYIRHQSEEDQLADQMSIKDMTIYRGEKGCKERVRRCAR